MIFRGSPRLRRVGWLPIGWLFVLLVAVSIEFLKWMRTRSISRVGSSRAEENATGFSASQNADVGSLTLPAEILPRPTTTALKNAAPLLLVSVTDVEVRAVLGIVPGALPTVISNRTYYDLGVVGDTRTYMVQATGMGPSGVRSCIEDGIRAFGHQAAARTGIPAPRC